MQGAEGEPIPDAETARAVAAQLHLLDEHDDDGCTPLHLALLNGALLSLNQHAQITLLQEHGDDGCTPLHLALLNGALCSSIRWSNRSRATCSASRDCWTSNPSAQSRCRSPRARVGTGHAECARLLLEAGADARLPCDGSSGLHIVASLAALPAFRAAAVATADLLVHHGLSVYALCASSHSASLELPL